jgi:O-antigen ligase
VALAELPFSLNQRVSNNGFKIDTALGWAALSFVPLAFLFGGSEDSSWRAAFEFFSLFVGAIWIGSAFLCDQWKLTQAKLFLPLLLLGCYAFFQTLPVLQGGQSISADRFATLRFLLELSALVVWASILLDFISKPRRLAILVHLMLAAGIASALFGLIRLATHSAAPELAVVGQDKAFAQFSNRNYFALMVEMVMGMSLGLLLNLRGNRSLIPLYLSTTLLLAITVVLTSSRGGVLAMIAQILFAAMYLSNQLWRKKVRLERGNDGLRKKQFVAFALSTVLIGSLLAVVVIGVATLGGEKLASRMDELPDEWSRSTGNAPQQRGDIWRATCAMIRANPIAGTGFGAYETAITRYHQAAGDYRPSSALNDYLNLLASGGLIAAVLASWFAINLFLRIRKRLKSKDAFIQAITVGGLTSLAGVAIHSLVDAGLKVPLNALLLFALIVILTAQVSAPARSQI